MRLKDSNNNPSDFNVDAGTDTPHVSPDRVTRLVCVYGETKVSQPVSIVTDTESEYTYAREKSRYRASLGKARKFTEEMMGRYPNAQVDIVSHSLGGVGI